MTEGRPYSRIPTRNTNAQPQPVIISPNQTPIPVTLSGGSSSTQYIDAASTPAHPTGTMPVFDNAGTISKVSNIIGLPVAIVGTPSVNATLSAETTKVIGTVNIAAGQVIGLSAGSQVIGHVIVDSGTITTVSAVTAITNALPAGTNILGKVSQDTSPWVISGAITEATLDAALIAQEATTSGIKGLTLFGAVTTGKPTYTTAKSDALSLDVNGLLRVSLADTPANTNKFLVTADAITFASPQHIIADSGTITTVSAVTAITNALPAGSNVIGHVIVDSGTVTTVSTVTSVSNLSQIASTTPTFGDVNNAAAEAGSLNVAPIGRYNATLPTITDTRYNQLQVGLRGAVQVNLLSTDGTTTQFLAAAALADTATANPATTTVGSVPLLMNASSLDRARAVINTLDSTGLGIQAVGIIGQFDDTLPTAATENKFDPIRISSRRELYVQIRDAAGNERGINVDANGGIPITIEAAQTLATVTTVSTVTAVTNITNAVSVLGSATGSVVPAGAFYQGFTASTSLPTAATAGNLTGGMSDKFGRQVVLPVTIRDLTGTQATTLSSTTAETTIVSQAASVFNDLLLLVLTNTSATATRVDFRDTTGGTVLFSLEAPAIDTRGFSLGGVAIPQTSVNTNWTAQCGTSIADLRIYAVFAKNK